MREPHALGHAAGVVNVLSGATGTLFRQRRAVIVKLQGHADHVIAFGLQPGRDDRAVHAARHRHDNAGIGGGLGETKAVQ